MNLRSLKSRGSAEVKDLSGRKLSEGGRLELGKLFNVWRKFNCTSAVNLRLKAELAA
ncbi:MAG: hypothetical protein ACTS6G_00330 [Candidatus Hodgkinia cicadicola]